MMPLMGVPSGQQWKAYTVHWDEKTGRVTSRSKYDGRPTLAANEMICTKDVYDNHTRYIYFRGLLLEQPE